MAEQRPNVEDIKAALVSSGILKATTISEAEREKIQKALAAKGVQASDVGIVCDDDHVCFVWRK